MTIIIIDIEAIGIIHLLILVFVSLSHLGWWLKALGWVLEFLLEGSSTSFGSLFRTFMAN